MTRAREESAAHAHRKADERGGKSSDSNAASRHAAHVKKDGRATGKRRNNFARATHLSPNRRISDELSSHLAIRNSTIFCVPPRSPLSALHWRELPASDHKKNPDKAGKTPRFGLKVSGKIKKREREFMKRRFSSSQAWLFRRI